MSLKKVKYVISPVDLKPQGINNVLFDRIDALQMIDLLSSMGISILGGDVYIKEDQEYNVTYDNWYCNKESNESINEFVFRSCLASKSYIENYNSSDCYFALVVR